MINFLINNLNILSILTGDCSVLGKDLTKILNEVFLWIQISVPCLVLVLCSVDMAKAVMSQDEKAVKESLSNSIKRLIIGVVIFFVPILINVLLDLAGLATGACKIGG